MNKRKGKSNGKKGIDDHIVQAGATAHDLENLPRQDLTPANVLEEYEPDVDAAKIVAIDPATKPLIVIGTKGLAETTDQAWAALLAANSPPVLYRQGDVLVRVAKDAKTGGPCLRVITHHRLRLRLARVAEWVKLVRGDLKPAFPLSAVVDAMLADDDAALPVLRRIVSVPVFAPDGRLLDTPDYDVPSGILYLPPEGLNLPPVPEVPTEVDVIKARELVQDMFCDFKFVGPADRAAAVALLLTAFARGLVDGPVPLFMIEKPTPGTGASLLMDCIGYVVFGHVMEKIPEAGSEEEWRKRITASLLLSPPYVVLDNLRKKLDSGSLSAAITSGIWRDRELGVSRMVTLQVECIWVCTANNPKVSKEMSRRIVPCRMDAKVERPWELSGFKHDPILSWIAEHRGALVWSCLVLIRHWLAAGRRPGPAKLGSFTEWAQALSGILEAVDIPGLLTNVADFYQRADDETAPIRAFLAAWWQRHGTELRLAKDLLPLALEAEVDVSAKTEHAQKIKMGLLLKSERDRRYRLGPDLEVRISGQEDSHDKVYRWQLTAVTDGSGVPDTLTDTPHNTPRDNSAEDGALRGERGAAGCSSLAHEKEQTAQSGRPGTRYAEIGSAAGQSSTPQQPALPATVTPDDSLNDLEEVL
jgi:putative DNA primase/helicase